MDEINRFVWNKTRSCYVEYLCVTDCDKDSIILQEGETIAYKWATADEIRNMSSEELLTETMRQFILNGEKHS